MARASGGRASSFRLNKTFDFVPSAAVYSVTEYLPWAFTQPPGTAPTGVISKSCLYGNSGATRTRARPTSSPALASTSPCCPGFLLSTTLPFSTVPSSAGGPFGAGASFLGSFPGGAFGGGGSGNDQVAAGNSVLT